MLKSFATLIQVAQDRTDHAAARVGQLQARLSESQQKHTLLENYRGEYRARLEAATQRGANAADMRNFRAFLDRLDEAVLQQQTDVAFWRDQIDAARVNWQSEQRSLNSYNTIAARRDNAARVVQARREQKQQDEFAARSAGAARFAFGD